MSSEPVQPGSSMALALSTIAFAVSFAVWGMLSPMSKTFQTLLRLNEQQIWLLLAIPVVLGSIGRLPMGMLTDRFGGRIVFGSLLVFISIPAFLLSASHSYWQLILWGLLLGMAGASFSVGVAFTSKWFPAERQGLVLGIYGAGNIGQSVALLCIPILSGLIGWRPTFRLFAAAALCWGVIFLIAARDSTKKASPKSPAEMARVLLEHPISWLLSFFYFVTFGGFVALSIGLPKLLQEIFHLTARDAGLRVAGFVVLATLLRPLGGWLSDSIGGARVLLIVFAAAAALTLGMTSSNIVVFTVGALGVAAAVGVGNGATFKLVPQYFPNDTGTVTGLVGAMGGVGGFFPPLVLGILRTTTGSYSLGFVFLTLFCLGCLALTYFILIPNRAGTAGK